MALPLGRNSNNATTAATTLDNSVRLNDATLMVVIMSLCLFFGYAMGHQPQPRLPGNDPDWGLLEFDNGSQWYVRGQSINAIWAIPEDMAKQLGGTRTKIYGTGFEINSSLTAVEIEKRIVRAKANRLIDLLEGME